MLYRDNNVGFEWSLMISTKRCSSQIALLLPCLVKAIVVNSLFIPFPSLSFAPFARNRMISEGTTYFASNSIPFAIFPQRVNSSIYIIFRFHIHFDVAPVTVFASLLETGKALYVFSSKMEHIFLIFLLLTSCKMEKSSQRKAVFILNTNGTFFLILNFRKLEFELFKRDDTFGGGNELCGRISPDSLNAIRFWGTIEYKLGVRWCWREHKLKM